METRPKSNDDNTSGKPASTTAGTVGAVAGRAHSALDSTVEKVAQPVNRMLDKAHEAIDRVADRAAPTASNLESAVRDAGDSTMRMMDSWAESIRSRPLAAVGMALAIGYIIGRLRS